MTKLNILNTFLLTVVFVGYVTTSLQYSQKHVQPFKALIVWHSSTLHSFLLQKDYVLRLVIELKTYAIDITIILVSASRNETLEVTKNDTKWLNDFANIRYEPVNEHDTTLQSKVITDAITEYINHNRTTKIAEELFLVVDDMSMIYVENVAATEWKRKKTFVICATKTEIPMIWQNLATDKNHLLKLTGIDDQIPDEHKLIELSYNDSRLPCDTNLYWDDGRCTECTYICSMVTKTITSTCRRKCPYLDRNVTNTSIVQANVETVISDNKRSIIVLISICTLLVFCMICFLICWFWIRKRYQRQRYVEEPHIMLNPNDANINVRYPVMATDHHPEHRENIDNSEDDRSETTSFLYQTSEDGRAEFPSGHEESTNHDDSSSLGQAENGSIESSDIPEEISQKVPIVLEFQNVNELNANGNAFGEPVVKLHTDGQREDATYVKGIAHDMI